MHAFELGEPRRLLQLLDKPDFVQQAVQYVHTALLNSMHTMSGKLVHFSHAHSVHDYRRACNFSQDYIPLESDMGAQGGGGEVDGPGAAQASTPCLDGAVLGSSST